MKDVNNGTVKENTNLPSTIPVAPLSLSLFLRTCQSINQVGKKVQLVTPILPLNQGLKLGRGRKMHHPVLALLSHLTSLARALPDYLPY
jgi:hypothetical protein